MVQRVGCREITALVHAFLFKNFAMPFHVFGIAETVGGVGRAESFSRQRIRVADRICNLSDSVGLLDSLRRSSLRYTLK